MADRIRSLDFDALVAQYVRLSPGVRYFQLMCLGGGFFPFAVFLLIVLSVGAELIFFLVSLILAAPIALDFNMTRDVLVGVLSDRHRFGWLIPESLFEVVWLCARALSYVLVAMAFISLRFNVFAYAAMAFVWVQLAIHWVTDRIPAHIGEWLARASLESESTLFADIWMLGAFSCAFWLVVRSLRIPYAMSQEERTIIREGRARLLHIANVLQTFGIPTNVRNSSRRLRTLIYAYLGNLVGACPPALLFISGGLLYFFVMVCIGPYFLWNWYDTFPIMVAMLGNIVVAIIVAAIPYLIFVGFRIFGSRSLRASRRFLRVSLEQAQARDPRQPVLFLRSFRDDAVALSPPKSGFAYRLFNYAERNKSLDELLLEEGTTLGPVVALGSPTDAIPPYGAARAYIQNADWQKMIAYLMEQAIVIVVCVDDSESLWWEIKFISERKYLGKTLFLLHPKYGSDKDVPDIVRDFETVLGVAVAREMNVPGRKFMGLWLDKTSHLQVGLASYFSRVHYLLMLRWFLRSKTEEAAKHPKNESFATYQ